MKLYFYFLREKEIRLEKCEVEEKPKTYRVVGKIPAEYYYSFVRKEDIGKMSGYNNDTVVLIENNVEEAASVFK